MKTTPADPTSLPPDQKEKLDKGVDDFWATFTATGAEAKILPTPQITPSGQQPEIDLPDEAFGKGFLSSDKEVDYDKITKREDLPKPIIPAYDRYTTERALNGLSHEKAMEKAFASDKARSRWSDIFKENLRKKVIMDIRNK